jgi:hypothetical protein
MKRENYLHIRKFGRERAQSQYEERFPSIEEMAKYLVIYEERFSST